MDSRSSRDPGFRRISFGAPSLLTCAIVAVALVAAILYVVTDAARTLDDVHQRNALIVQVNATQPRLLRQFTMPATARRLSPIDEAEATQGIVSRGALAFALAFLVIGLGYRRRLPKASGTDVALGDLLGTIPYGVACWSEDGRLMVCNEQYRSRLNADPVDSRPGALYSASIRRLVQGGYMELISDDAQSRMIELHREDGSRLIIDERPLDSGGFVTLVTDVTENRRTDDLLVSIREEQRVLARRYHEEKLRAEAASRSKTSFLAHLSHEIRTPLNHIIGFAELMRHETYGPLGDDRYSEYVESIRTSGQRLLSFFASILDYAELEGGRRSLQEEELGADELLAAATRRFSALAQRKGVALSLGTACGASIIGDRFSLERVLGNVLDNAIRYTPAGGRVRIAAYAAADGVVIEVTDTGIGMSPERLSSLSQPFAYGDAALTRDREGAGLGLAIARTIVELSGGRLAIDSRLGLGTTVAISLPLHRDAGTIDVAA